MYGASIAFNAENCPSFLPTVEAMGQHGPGPPGMKPPSYNGTRVTYLNKEVTHTMIEGSQKDWGNLDAQ